MMLCLKHNITGGSGGYEALSGRHCLLCFPQRHSAKSADSGFVRSALQIFNGTRLNTEQRHCRSSLAGFMLAQGHVVTK